MKKFHLLIVVTFMAFSINLFAQLDSVYYIGPATGNVVSGVTVSLTQFTFDEPITGNRIADRYTETPYFDPNPPDLKPSNFPGYVYVEDSPLNNSINGTNPQTIIVDKWDGIDMGNSIPPDPTLAVGPEHVIAFVNSAFNIWDKEGNLLASVSADNWIQPVVSPGAFDPQILYDHYQNRWFMVWDWQDSGTQQAWFIISYSDDADPFGTWYMYKMDARVNGTTNSGTWGDFPQIGYDDEAIYINSRSFTWAGNYLYNRIRILNKSQLYSSNGGNLPFVDVWSIGRPNAPSDKPDVLMPAKTYSPGQGGYFFNTLQNGGNYYILYKILNPISVTPRLRGKTIATTFYGGTPLAGQLGGGMGIESGGSKCRHSPVIRDGFLYAAHTMANSTTPSYSSLRYNKIELNSATVVEQSELGGIGNYYLYPALTVDKDHNIAITFSRSATTEYVGAFISTKFANDTTGLNPSMVIQPGLGNYVVDFGSGRNRWGDYMGIQLDPVNEYDIWTFTEYAKATNFWGTYVGRIRMVPFAGSYTFLSTDALAFGNIEINTISDTLEVIIANYGTDNLEITDVTSSVGPFTRIGGQTFPQTLQSYDSLTLKVIFSPIDLGDYDETLVISSSDTSLPNIQLTGHCFEINIPYSDMFYASSGGGNNGDMLTINPTTGVATLLGPSLYGEVKGLSVNPLNDVLYGLVSGGSNSEIVRVNASQGDSYALLNLDLTALTGMDFDTTGILYVCDQDGKIFTVDQNNGNYSLVTTTTHPLNGIAFHPITNQLWGVIRKTFGNRKDSVYTINLATGEATPVGVTGLNVMTNDLAFDENSKLYGVTGSSNQEGQFFEIDQVTGTGTLIGTGLGYNHTTGIAYSINGPVVSVDGENSLIPKIFSLNQNYPNPFNPTTSIEFSLPVSSDVELVVFNILGQKVSTLINEQQSAGYHSVVWNSDDSNGLKLSSGIYFYKLKATGIDGSDFVQVRKMVLLK